MSEMARTSNQKVKLLVLLDYLRRASSEENPVRLTDMAAELERNGIRAERKALYNDIEELSACGYEVLRVGNGFYYLAGREFELAELKLLVDSVQASRFLTQRKSDDLIRKLEGLTSEDRARQLRRQVLVQNRVKTMNESIYYNVDGIHAAIGGDQQIRFHYFDHDLDRKRVLRRDGEFYQVSPFSLLWAEDNYYLIAYNSGYGELRHYRVDKMCDIAAENLPREGKELFAALDARRYTSRVFGMFRGEEQELVLRFRRHLIGSVLDRFGQDAILVPDGAEHFRVKVTVSVSPQFYGWLCGFGNEAAILAPSGAAAEFREYVQGILENYPQ